MAEFYHDLITEKSYQVLQDLRGRFSFVLIGGWAVFVYTKALKSKDVDVKVVWVGEGKARLVPLAVIKGE